jgi:hypothetical protein
MPREDLEQTDVVDKRARSQAEDRAHLGGPTDDDLTAADDSAFGDEQG